MDSPSKLPQLQDSEAETLRGEGQLFIYSILDVAVGRQALYARGLQVLWRCFQLLARQLRLRHAAEQKVETLKGEVALWKRKADEALQRLEVLQGLVCFAQDERTDTGSQTEKQQDIEGEEENEEEMEKEEME
ncbi:hypothetical protein JOQ06_011780 [Pogonophryne albipinna]|uniref:Uncharacterized protein n=1 Tax=Pogonophryne albipinna TaxID=1090488 RepID=A0AAD6F2M8_9TELE|nr:hypothetical protein JOQ06_021232 [Pogonophryne albipinna]KAJ4941908.1 hypothetical protein JOQ06_011780 [Pogonophryne albipinna]